jgi:hypothetical protein
MSDDPIMTCKHCGETLTTDAPNPGPENVMSCPIHGPMGKLGDLVAAYAGTRLPEPFGKADETNRAERRRLD